MSSDETAPDSSSRNKSPPSTPVGRGDRLARGVAPALGLVVCAWVSTFLIAAAERKSPEAADWQSAATYITAQRAALESPASGLIVFAPRWIDPIGRQYLGDQMDIEMAARMDASRYSRIWELSVGGARAPETAEAKMQGTQSFGPIEVRTYLQEPALVATDFTSDWKRAAVSGQMQGRPNLSLQEVGFAPHWCVKVVPKPNQTVSMRFDSVSLGNEIVAYVGLADIFTRRDVRSPGSFEILVDGASVALATVTVDNGWQRVRAPTDGGHASVEFRFTAVGEGARDRRICFAAEARQ